MESLLKLDVVEKIICVCIFSKCDKSPQDTGNTEVLQKPTASGTALFRAETKGKEEVGSHLSQQPTQSSKDSAQESCKQL